MLRGTYFSCECFVRGLICTEPGGYDLEKKEWRLIKDISNLTVIFNFPCSSPSQIRNQGNNPSIVTFVIPHKSEMQYLQFYICSTILDIWFNNQITRLFSKLVYFHPEKIWSCVFMGGLITSKIQWFLFTVPLCFIMVHRDVSEFSQAEITSWSRFVLLTIYEKLLEQNKVEIKLKSPGACTCSRQQTGAPKSKIFAHN